jgi:hypothetical protein
MPFIYSNYLISVAVCMFTSTVCFAVTVKLTKFKINSLGRSFRPNLVLCFIGLFKDVMHSFKYPFILHFLGCHVQIYFIP